MRNSRPRILVADESDAPEAISGLSKEEAEGLLDWLEAHHCRDLEVCLDEAGGFTVRYRRPLPVEQRP